MNLNIGTVGNKARWETYGENWPAGYRECLSCGEIKSITNFHKHRQCKDGVNSICKECRKPLSKRHYASTKKEYRLWCGARGRAKKNGRDFNIEVSDIFIPEICPVLNITISEKGDYAPSLDRIDSSKGYTKDNIRVISKRANVLKNNASIEELELILNDLKNREVI